MVLEKTLESPLDCKDIPPVHSEGDQPWDFFGRNDARAETPVFLPGKSHGQRSLVGHRLKGLKLVGHDLVAEYARTLDEYNCTLFSLQYTVVLYEYTRFYLSSVQSIEIGNGFSFF